MYDLMIYRPDWNFRWSYDNFEEGFIEPYTYHQLCLGPLVIEWKT